VVVDGFIQHNKQKRTTAPFPAIQILLKRWLGSMVALLGELSDYDSALRLLILVPNERFIPR
jgi:hypothetical protein